MALDPLPEGFIEEMFSSLHDDTIFLLMNTLLTLKSTHTTSKYKQPESPEELPGDGKKKRGKAAAAPVITTNTSRPRRQAAIATLQAIEQSSTSPRNTSKKEQKLQQELESVPKDVLELQQFICFNIKFGLHKNWRTLKLLSVLLTLIQLQLLPNVIELELSFSPRDRESISDIVKIDYDKIIEGFKVMKGLKLLKLDELCRCSMFFGLLTYSDPSTLFPSLEELNLENNCNIALYQEFVETLVTSGHIPTLKKLYLPSIPQDLNIPTFDRLFKWIDTTYPSLNEYRLSAYESGWGQGVGVRYLEHFMERISGFTYNGNNPPTIALDAIQSSAKPLSLTSLSISSFKDAELMKVLSGSVGLSNLKELVLNHCLVTDDDIKMLCESPFLTHLESLTIDCSVSNNQAAITEKAYEYIANSRNMSNLVNLSIELRSTRPGNLGNNTNTSGITKVSSECFKHLGNSKIITKLKSLSILHGINYTSSTFLEDFKALLDSDLIKTVEKLRINSSLPPDAILLFNTSSCLTSLSSLQLSSQLALSEKLSHSFFRNPNNVSLLNLKSLTLSNNRLSDGDVLNISSSPWLKDLRELDIRDNYDLTDQATLHLSDSLYIKSLRTLDIRNCDKITCQSALHLMGSFYLKFTLKSILVSFSLLKIRQLCQEKGFLIDEFQNY